MSTNPPHDREPHQRDDTFSIVSITATACPPTRAHTSDHCLKCRNLHGHHECRRHGHNECPATPPDRSARWWCRCPPRLVTSSPESYEVAVQQRLWAVSEDLTGVKFPVVQSKQNSFPSGSAITM